MPRGLLKSGDLRYPILRCTQIRYGCPGDRRACEQILASRRSGASVSVGRLKIRCRRSCNRAKAFGGAGAILCPTSDHQTFRRSCDRRRGGSTVERAAKLANVRVVNRKKSRVIFPNDHRLKADTYTRRTGERSGTARHSETPKPLNRSDRGAADIRACRPRRRRRTARGASRSIFLAFDIDQIAGRHCQRWARDRSDRRAIRLSDLSSVNEGSGSAAPAVLDNGILLREGHCWRADQKRQAKAGQDRSKVLSQRCTRC